MKSAFAIVLIGLSAAVPAAAGAPTPLTGEYLEGQWAPADDPGGCKAATGPKFLPDQRIPTPTGDTIAYRLLPGSKGIGFTDWDGQQIAYLIKVLGQDEIQLEVTYNGLAAEFDEPVIYRRCGKP